MRVTTTAPISGPARLSRPPIKIMAMTEMDSVSVKLSYVTEPVNCAVRPPWMPMIAEVIVNRRSL
ncbi:MAG TPA: hypothetical protein VHT26_10505 [Trebonia sp.]|nr:hypothetical protein [Trebonia sp.]